MGNWSLGSVTDTVHNLVDNIPTGVSGDMLNIADRKLGKIDIFLSTTTGSNAIPRNLQGPLLDLTRADVLRAIETQGTDASSIKLDDFTIKKGKGSSAMDTAQSFEDQAWMQLKDIKGRYNFFKALG